jgi:hypothetical protein
MSDLPFMSVGEAFISVGQAFLPVNTVDLPPYIFWSDMNVRLIHRSDGFQRNGFAKCLTYRSYM